MPFGRVVLAVLSSAMVGSAASAAASAADCAATAGLIRQARTDFLSLRHKKMEAGKCVYSDSQYKCEWAFPGDAFAVSDAQARRLVQCVATAPTAQRAKGKKGENAFSVDPDLTVLVESPDLDDGNWKIRLRILSSWKPQ